MNGMNGKREKRETWVLFKKTRDHSNGKRKQNKNQKPKTKQKNKQKTT